MRGGKTKSTLVVLACLVSVTLLPAAAQQGGTGITYKQVTVVATNDEWTSTRIKVDSTGVAIIIAEGKVSISSTGGSYDANGGRTSENQITTAELIGKIGTGSSFAIGKKFVLASPESGTLKLKVHDGQYNDNSGAFTVHVIYLPYAALPEAEKVVADE